MTDHNKYRVRDLVPTRLIERFPSILPREPDSVFRRYVDAHDERFDVERTKLDDVLASSSVNHATGKELNQIGRKYGLLGARRGRDDADYRAYLKSLPQAFSGRGTVQDIKFAVAAGIGLDEEDVDVTEDFQNLEYELTIRNWTDPHSTEQVHELADLADASVATRADPLRYELEGAIAGAVAPGGDHESLGSGMDSYNLDDGTKLGQDTS